MPAERDAVAAQGRFTQGLDAPICLTWELTYACNLACVHCLSSSGRRDPAELTPAEARHVVDELATMKVFYVNIGGGEPMLRPDFFDLVGYAVDQKVGVKFSTNGTRLTAERARRLAGHGLRRRADQHRRGAGVDQRRRPRRGVLRRGPDRPWTTWPPPTSGRSRSAWWSPGRTSPSSTASPSIAESYGAQLRLTRFRPSGRGVDTWDALHPTAEQQRMLYHWLLDRPDVLTGDSFFHLSALGEPLDGLNLCGAGRVVCLIDPVGDVYACPFVIDEEFLAGNVAPRGGLRRRVARLGPVPVAARAAECRAPAPRAAPTTPARAAAWRPSSSPACRSTAPTPSACSATERRRWPPATPAPLPGAAVGHSKVDRQGTPIPVPTPVRFRSPPASRGRTVATMDSAAPPGPRWRRRDGTVPVLASRSAHSNSTDPICRSTPTPGSPSRWPTGWPVEPSRCGGVAPGPGLRRQRRARRRFPGRSSSITGCWPTSWSSWCARPGAPSAASSVISAHGGNAKALALRRGAVPGRR